MKLCKDCKHFFELELVTRGGGQLDTKYSAAEQCKHPARLFFNPVNGGTLNAPCQVERLGSDYPPAAGFFKTFFPVNKESVACGIDGKNWESCRTDDPDNAERLYIGGRFIGVVDQIDKEKIPGFDEIHVKARLVYAPSWKERGGSFFFRTDSLDLGEPTSWVFDLPEKWGDALRAQLTFRVKNRAVNI